MNLKPLTEEEKQKLFKNIFNSIKVKESKKKRNKFAFAVMLIILITVGGFLGYDNMKKADVYFSETRTTKIYLKDGTEVLLMKDAKLTVDRSFPGKIREVYLEGDALFKVSKSREHPFIVYGTNYKTKVLGTVFKVVQQNGTFVVHLYEGKVAVSQKGNEKAVYYLKPEQTFNNYGKKTIATVLSLQDKKQTKETEKLKLKPATVEHADFHFRSCNVSDAVAVIEKLFDIKVEYPKEFGNTKISTDFIQSSKQNIMQTFAAYLDLSLIQDDNLYKLQK